MSEHDTTNTTTNEQHALILKLIQERIAAKLEDLENNRNSNDSLLDTLKTEINDLLESGNNINNSLPKPEVADESIPKPKPGAKTNTDDKATGNATQPKTPATTKEVKTGQIEGKDSKGKSDKPQSQNEVSEEKKTDATPKTQKKPVTTKPEPKKTDKPVKKGPTDTKKKEEEKGEGHEEEKHEEDNAADQEQPPEVLALKELNKSLTAINKKDLSELAALSKAPANVEKMVSAVLAILGEKESWTNAKTALKKPDLIDKLKKVNAESLSDKVTKKVRDALSEPDNSEENLAKFSKVACNIAKWLHCLIKVRDFKKGPETAETQEKEEVHEEKVEQKVEPVEEKKEGEAEAEAVPNKDENSEEALIEACKNALKPLDFNKVQMATAAPNPAPKVVKVFEAICILLGEKASWDNAKKVAKFKDFLKKLENLKPEAVSDKIFQKVKKFIADEGLKPEALAAGNAAAKQLCQWINSFVKLKEITKGPEGEVKEGNEDQGENKEHNTEHVEEKKEEGEGEKDKGAKESAKKDTKKAVDSKKDAEAKTAPKKPVPAAKKDDKKDDKTKAKAPKKDEKKEEAGEEKTEQPEEKKEEGEAKKAEDATKKDVKKGTDTKATADKKDSKRPVTAAKKDDKKEEKKEKEDKSKDAKKEDKEKDTKTVTTPKAIKDKAPKEEKKTSAKPAETKKTDKQTAKPELKSILDTITSSDISELKGMPKPPAQIVDAVNLVSLLVQGKEQPWADLTKAFLTNTVTLHKALNINLANVSQESIDAVNKKITDSKIDEASLRKKSSASVALFKWVQEAIKLSEQAKQNPAAEEAKDLNGVAHPEGDHSAQEQEIPKKEEAEAPSETHLNGEQAHSEEPSHKEEVEKKEEPPKVEEEEQKQEINREEAFDKLSEALGYNVLDEVTDGNLEGFINKKFKELEDKIKTLNAQNAELKNAGVPENVEKDKNFAQNETTSELLKTVEKDSVTELLGQENWDEETSNLLALICLIKGNNDVPTQSDQDKFKAYVKEKLENEEDPAGFLSRLGENINLDTQKKIELQDFLKGKQSIFDFQGANVFAKGAAAITKDVSEHLGVVPEESATETSVKERVYAFNEEKIAMYNLKENKIIEIAHKYNVALDS